MIQLANKFIGLLLGSLIVCLLAVNIYLYNEINVIQEHNVLIKTQLSQNNQILNRAIDADEDTSKLKTNIAQTCDRIELGNRFAKLNQDLKLVAFHFRVNPEEVISQNQCRLVKSLVSLEFENHEDVTLYRMIEIISNEFPGLTLPKELSITRDPSSTKPLLKGRFTYEWLSTKERDQKL